MAGRMIAGKQTITGFLHELIEQLEKGNQDQSGLAAKDLRSDVGRLLKPLYDSSKGGSRGPTYASDQLGLKQDSVRSLDSAMSKAQSQISNEDLPGALRTMRAALEEWTK